MTARATEAKIARTLAAIVAAGLGICEVSVAKDGTVTVKTVDKTREDVQPKGPKAWAKR